MTGVDKNSLFWEIELPLFETSEKAEENYTRIKDIILKLLEEIADI